MDEVEIQNNLSLKDDKSINADHCQLQKQILRCPKCKTGVLVIDGCLNRVCADCGYVDPGGSFT